MKPLLTILAALLLLTGCATRQAAQATSGTAADDDARTRRGLLDTMASAAHRFPSN